jgi:hypothetical protein
VEEIRRAGALLRERAQAATPGPWEPRRGAYPSVEAANGHLVMETVVCDEETHGDRAVPDAEHIASWHPAVALAVADWLFHTATLIELNPTGLAGTQSSIMADLVARAYLAGEQP